MKKFTKSEIKKFDCAIDHIRDSFEDGGHDAHSALYCSGITFADEIKRFMSYAEMKPAPDVVDGLASENAHKLSATTKNADVLEDDSMTDSQLTSLTIHWVAEHLEWGIKNKCKCPMCSLRKNPPNIYEDEEGCDVCRRPLLACKCD